MELLKGLSMLLQHAYWARAEASDLGGIAIAAAADPNWLLSAILQSSVAMVVALATLWLWQMQERSRVLEAWQQAQERVAAAEQSFDRVNESIERHAALCWLISAMDQLVRTPDASLDFLLSRCGSWEYGTSVLATAVNEVSGYVRNALAEIVDASRGQPLTIEWEEFRITHGIPIGNPLQEMVYERVYLKLMVDQRAPAVETLHRARPLGRTSAAEEQFGQPESPLEQPGLRSSSPGGAPGAGDGPTARHALVVTSADGQRLEAERADIVQQMFEAQTAAESAEAQRARGARSWSARWYLAVTVYVSLIGVVMPSLVLTLAPTSLKVELRWLLFIAFCTVVAAVASTFAVTIRVRGKALLSRANR